MTNDELIAEARLWPNGLDGAELRRYGALQLPALADALEATGAENALLQARIDAVKAAYERSAARFENRDHGLSVMSDFMRDVAGILSEEANDSE